MEHHFNTDHAVEYGIEEAIVISNFVFWITKNRANKANIREIEIDKKLEKRTFTYNSANAMSELFPYLSPKQIYRVMESLVEQKVLIKRNFNSNRYDRTLWYCFRNEEAFLGKVKGNSRKREMDGSQNENQFPKSGNDYTDSKPDINTDSKPQTSNPETFRTKLVSETKEPEPVKTLTDSLKEIAMRNNLAYSLDRKNEGLFQNKLSIEMSQTNEHILAQAYRFEEILRKEPTLTWLKNDAFGFKFLQFNWGKIDSWHLSKKPIRKLSLVQKEDTSYYDESKKGIAPTLEQLERMYK